jgi:hypothetical protein
LLPTRDGFDDNAVLKDCANGWTYVYWPTFTPKLLYNRYFVRWDGQNEIVIQKRWMADRRLFWRVAINGYYYPSLGNKRLKQAIRDVELWSIKKKFRAVTNKELPF